MEFPSLLLEIGLRELLPHPFAEILLRRTAEDRFKRRTAEDRFKNLGPLVFREQFRTEMLTGHSYHLLKLIVVFPFRIVTISQDQLPKSTAGSARPGIKRTSVVGDA